MGAQIAVVVAAYLIGTFPTALLVGRRRGVDPTTAGSGNPGATNVYRVAGRRAGVVVLVGDVVKGALPAAVGLAVGGRAWGVAAGAAAVLGHIAPVTRRLRGGKGVATAGGMSLVLWPVPALALVGVFAVVSQVSRAASLGSLAMAVGLPVGVALVGRPGWEVAAAAAMAVVVVARHHANIRRLLRGDELGVPTGPVG
ncbi:MAG TPA: glycerol-3-phosphate 1-O-acyltransferase PlsY [Acidimicrobiales bacterium]|nr:glycerol-3-phosphate 1-O-acyltransferase PlsY [Acidimicrobiales bacterium]